MITSLHTCSSHNALWLGRIVNKSQYKSLPHLHKPSLRWEKIWYYNLIPLIIIIIIIIIEYSYSYYLIFFLGNLFLDNSTLKFRLIDHFKVVTELPGLWLEARLSVTLF